MRFLLLFEFTWIVMNNSQVDNCDIYLKKLFIVGCNNTYKYVKSMRIASGQ